MVVTNQIEYRKVQGWAHHQSLAVILPRRYADNLKITKGDVVKIMQSGAQLTLEKV